LLKTTDISECSVGCITNYGMAVHKPASMVVEVSEDNVNFAEVGRTDFSKEEIFKEGNFIEELTVKPQAAKARYVRFTLNPAGVCPSDHVRPGQVSKICLDEIMIK
ncbi:MAG: beta-hexosaminidase, partial [Bacteroides sp.]|nr:beta-hexosaminidase [Bacteroides sp.]